MTVTERASRTSAYRKRYILDVTQGVPRSNIPAGPVSSHVAGLLAAGVSKRAVSELASVSQTTVRHVAAGTYPTVHRDVAARLMRVSLATVLTERERPNDRLPALGAVRRVRALVALGHTHAAISAAMGINDSRSQDLTGAGLHWVFRSTYLAVLCAYDALSMRPGPSTRNVKRAAGLGWAPPLAWDDDTIDDPEAGPNLVGDFVIGTRVDDAVVERVLAGEALPTTVAERELIVPRLHARGLTDGEIADLCQVWGETIVRIRKRLGVGGKYQPAPEPRAPKSAPDDEHRAVAEASLRTSMVPARVIQNREAVARHARRARLAELERQIREARAS